MAHAIKDKFKLALAQLNPVVGDLEGNLRKARETRARAADAGADLIAFTELSLVGYPPEDLVLKPALQKAAREACEALARDTKDGGPAMLVGLPWGEAPSVYNAVALLDGGRIEAVRYKIQSAELWRVRREARVRPGSLAAADPVQRGEARRADLRGHLERGRLQVACRSRAPSF